MLMNLIDDKTIIIIICLWRDNWAKFCSNDNNDDKDDGEGLLKQSFVNVRGWRNRCSYLSSLSHLSWSSMMIIVNGERRREDLSNQQHCHSDDDDDDDYDATTTPQSV